MPHTSFVELGLVGRVGSGRLKQTREEVYGVEHVGDGLLAAVHLDDLALDLIESVEDVVDARHAPIEHVVGVDVASSGCARQVGCCRGLLFVARSHGYLDGLREELGVACVQLFAQHERQVQLLGVFAQHAHARYVAAVVVDEAEARPNAHLLQKAHVVLVQALLALDLIADDEVGAQRLATGRSGRH